MSCLVLRSPSGRGVGDQWPHVVILGSIPDTQPIGIFIINVHRTSASKKGTLIKTLILINSGDDTCPEVF